MEDKRHRRQKFQNKCNQKSRGKDGVGTESLFRNIFEEMKAENFPKLMTDINPQIQETPSTPYRINEKNPICLHQSNSTNLRGKEKVLKSRTFV